MSTGAKELVKRYVEEFWNKGDLEGLKNLTTEDFNYHLGLQPPRDREEMAEFIKVTHHTFPDWRVEITDMIAEGDRVVIKWRGKGTHRESFHGIPATGREIKMGGINIYRLEGGRIAEEWEQTDTVSMLQQMGVLPAT
ncbi:MAG: ester cyclase [Candidatus Krumholzibacteriota bacterium]|nr:ester cyclase [Candidatus Krumholzibacteriota bacterium]